VKVVRCFSVCYPFVFMGRGKWAFAVATTWKLGQEPKISRTPKA